MGSGLCGRMSVTTVRSRQSARACVERGRSRDGTGRSCNLPPCVRVFSFSMRCNVVPGGLEKGWEHDFSAEASPDECRRLQVDSGRSLQGDGSRHGCECTAGTGGQRCRHQNLTDPKQRSFKQAMISVVFTCIWLEATLHLLIVGKCGRKGLHEKGRPLRLWSQVDVAGLPGRRTAEECRAIARGKAGACPRKGALRIQ